MKSSMERAKELYLQYCGNHYFMALNGDEKEYDRYRISKETEDMWRREWLDQFFEQKRYGKDAIGAYAKAVAFLKSDRSDEDGQSLLYYPLASVWLDDVTVLYMLRDSFRLAEKWAGKGKLSREDTGAYLQTLDRFIQSIQQRSEAGTLTRAVDYTQQEFSDPVYTADYLEKLRDDWRRMHSRLL